MTSQIDKAKAFHALHVKGDPVVLYNIWDPGSAAIVAKAGAKAIATGSWPVAAAFGFADGEKIPLDLALYNIRRIVAATDLPVTMDLEGGYGVEPEAVAATVTRALAEGVIGFNFEDQIVGGSGLHDIAVQVKRIAAAADAVKASGIPAFINARTDIFLKAKPDEHSDTLVDAAIERAEAYAKAGAHGFFAPGLGNEALIGKLCKAVSLPVNIIALAHVPPKAKLAELGVARISYGPVPYRQMAEWLEAKARAAFE
ncbi:isocitrate lyase/PEP mutase family protein [Aminobacter ciceronei]|uniref:2-methylisocitrate lyase-like PEP mutase family enzyme n=1 Tax=Aminobacter ciceronei TaxID=150723 RepID=A0ABR6CGS9_9HYPH|nr:isocitrate lyase/phosphoenolpyruvate mutase family protein [Aminobacter ciceronei]MBA8910031.1 2-methylisocitrate lyase-like PEP mutase family enzyme [Aminobacter ciceronei]MBA9023775.1 2-methylisocitrate lyase-like PEP mutase family enzyme [Aminobacter ciceronei]